MIAYETRPWQRAVYPSLMAVIMVMLVHPARALRQTDCSTPTALWAVPSTADALLKAYLALAPLLRTPGCATQLTGLVACTDQMSIMAGCCNNAQCTSSLVQCGRPCLLEFLCKVDADPIHGPALSKYIDSLLARCNPDAISVAECKVVQTSNATQAPSPADCIEPYKYPLLASSTGACNVTSYFFTDVTPQHIYDLFFLGLSDKSCMGTLVNVITSCTNDFTVRSGCCSQACAHALLSIPGTCATAALAVACSLDPRRPVFKGLVNIMKRCWMGVAYVCPAITRLTYPLRVWDSCDCPIRTKIWEDGYTGGNISQGLVILEGRVSDYCYRHVQRTLEPCAAECAVEDGCCSSTCWKAINTLGAKECMTQYMAVMCESSATHPQAMRSFVSVAKRCLDDSSFQPTCVGNTGSINNSSGAGSPGSARSTAAALAPAVSWWTTATTPLLLWMILLP